MKKIMCAGMFLLCVGAVQAQTVKAGKKPAANNTISTSAKKTTIAKQTKDAASMNTTSGSAVSIGNYAAYPPAVNKGLYIADPTIRTLNERAASGRSAKIIGVPKLTYGVANGNIIFYNTGANTSGSYTGSGAVGTGTSVGRAGAVGPAMGVNGKSPYAGPGVWGTTIGVDYRGPNRLEQAIQGVKEK